MILNLACVRKGEPRVLCAACTVALLLLDLKVAIALTLHGNGTATDTTIFWTLGAVRVGAVVLLGVRAGGAACLPCRNCPKSFSVRFDVMGGWEFRGDPVCTP